MFNSGGEVYMAWVQSKLTKSMDYLKVYIIT